MGYDLIEMGRLDDAERMLRKCLEVAPGDAAVQDELNYIEQQRARKKTTS